MHRATSLGLTACFILAVSAMGGCDEESNADSSSASTTNPTQAGGGGAGAGAAGGGTSVGGSGAAGGGGSGGVMTVGNYDCSAPSGSPGNLARQEIVSGLDLPVGVTHAPGDSERLYVFEQDGRIQLVKNGVVTQFLDISARVARSHNERGLLGLAFHPNYAENGRFFVHYSNDNTNGPSSEGEGATVIEEYQRDASNPDLADPTPVQLVFDVAQDAGNHNGGSIHFNPVDGFLWIGIGDGGGGYDTYNHGQTKTTTLAALLRLDVDSAQPYASPTGNITDGAPEVHDWGLRNPYRWSFDVCTGDRYIGDVGQDCYEEISIAAANAGNVNFGWSVMEGNHCLGNDAMDCGKTPPGDCDDTGMQPAAVEFNTSIFTTVVGGHVYRGAAIPWLRGAYVYMDYVNSGAWYLRWENGAVTEGPVDIGAQIGEQLSAGLGLDNDGELYVVRRGQNPNEGILSRVVAE